MRPGLSADVYSGKAVMMKLAGPFFARAGRGFVSSHIKFNIAMSRPIWQEVAGHSGLPSAVSRSPGKGIRAVGRSSESCSCVLSDVFGAKLDCAGLHEVEVWRLGGWSTIMFCFSSSAIGSRCSFSCRRAALATVIVERP